MVEIPGALPSNMLSMCFKWGGVVVLFAMSPLYASDRFLNKWLCYKYDFSFMVMCHYYWFWKIFPSFSIYVTGFNNNLFFFFFPLWRYFLLIHIWNLHRYLFMKVRTVAMLLLSRKSSAAEKNCYVGLFSLMFSKYNSTAVWFLKPSALICLDKISH